MLPNFWTELPTVWFIQTESQLAIRNMTTDNTKYNGGNNVVVYVIAALDQATTKYVIDLQNRPAASCVERRLGHEL